jgi:hypothetical protein
VDVGRCTTFENAHRTVLREVVYRYHPWFGRRVCVHGTVDKASLSAARWMDRERIGGWRFQHGCSTGRELFAAQPFVSITALAALSALLDLALKDRTPSAALLSGASRASHDQNRGETHVTADSNARERIPTQSTTAVAAADGSVREWSVERRHRRARMAGAAGGSPGGSMTQLILDHAATTATPRTKEVSHDL